MQIEQAIGQRIRTLRQGTGLTQAALGALMPTPWARQAVHAAEAGARAFAIADLVGLAEALGVSVATLLGENYARQGGDEACALLPSARVQVQELRERVEQLAAVLDAMA